MPIGGLFRDQLKPGDVIYGITRDRWDYVNSLPKDLELRLSSNGQFIYVNGYNDNTFGTPRSPQTEEDIKFNVEHHEKRSDLSLPQKNALRSYYGSLRSHKHAPLEAVKMSGAQMQAKGNLSFAELVWRRASKFGLEYLITRTECSVHFILDNRQQSTRTYMGRIDSSFVVEKRKHWGSVPITTSELRCCYRNRLRWNGRVKFYFLQREVVAPWIARPEVWLEYERHRVEKGRPPVVDAPMPEMPFAWNHFPNDFLKDRHFSQEELYFSDDHFK
jgi:hypothetical protein